jgi:hypothetical protein
MKLEIDQRKRLLDELKDVYSTESDVKTLALMAFGVSLDQITLAPNLAAKLQDMVTRAEDENSLGKLLDAAIDIRPAAQPLIALRGELAAQIIAEREDHYKACWLLGDRVLLDRKPLREALKRVNDVQAGKHILVVHGPSLSGKSHSYQMIRYLQERRGGFKLVWVDMKTLVASAAGDELRPEELGQALVDQMNLSENMPPRSNEQDARWVQRFCNWLTGRLAGSSTLYWIVLDSFDKTLVPTGVHDLIRELAVRVESNLGQVRLILLGYKEQDKQDLPSEVFGGLEEETLGPIAEQELDHELIRFFSELYTRHKQQALADFTALDVANSVAQVKREVDFTSARYLILLSQSVIKESKRILSSGI